MAHETAHAARGADGTPRVAPPAADYSEGQARVLRRQERRELAASKSPLRLPFVAAVRVAAVGEWSLSGPAIQTEGRTESEHFASGREQEAERRTLTGRRATSATARGRGSRQAMGSCDPEPGRRCPGSGWLGGGAYSPWGSREARCGAEFSGPVASPCCAAVTGVSVGPPRWLAREAMRNRRRGTPGPDGLAYFLRGPLRETLVRRCCGGSKRRGCAVPPCFTTKIRCSSFRRAARPGTARICARRGTRRRRALRSCRMSTASMAACRGCGRDLCRRTAGIGQMAADPRGCDVCRGCGGSAQT